MKRYLAVIILMILAQVVFGADTNQGKAGMSFLKVAIDARAAGMAEAYTAVSEDASATYWNPAGLMLSRRANVLFNHNEWIEGVRGEFGAVALAGKRSAWGFHIRSFNIGDIQVRGDIPTTEQLDNTSANYLSAGLSYARRLRSNIDVGVTFKYLFEKIYIESASGLAADLGIVYRPAIPNLRFGAALQNLGKMNKFKNEETVLPVIFRVGGLYEIPAGSGIVSAKLAADVVKTSYENLRVQVGTEVLLWRQIALRGGFMSGYEARNYSFGVGFVRSSIRLDYALTPFSDNLGVTQRFTVNFNL